MKRRFATPLEAELAVERAERRREELRLWSRIVTFAFVFAVAALVSIGLSLPWAFGIALSVLAVFLVGLWMRAWLQVQSERLREKRFRDGGCFACGYDLRSNTGFHCSECGTSDFRLALRQRPIPPPWKILNLIMASMYWRMGEGAYVLAEWRKWYSLLTEAERRDYASRFPESIDWPGFYEDEDVRVRQDKEREGVN